MSQFGTACKRYVLPLLILFFPMVAYQNCGLGIPRLPDNKKINETFGGLGGLNTIMANNDWDTSGDGRLFLINDTKFMCYESNGNLLKETTLDTRQKEGTILATNHSGNTTVVAERIYKIAGDASSRTYFLTLYDRSCNPLHTPIEIDGVSASRSLAVDKNGSVAFVYLTQSEDVKVAIISRDGSLLTTLSPFVTAPAASTITVGLSVDNNSGVGVVLRQGKQNDALFFQRFNISGSLIDAIPVEVEHSVNHSNYNYSSLVGINNQGQIAIFWADLSDNLFHVNFYDGAAVLVNHITLPGPANTVDLIGNIEKNKFTLRTVNNNFLVPTNWLAAPESYSQNIAIYRANGTLVKTIAFGSDNDTRYISVDNRGLIYFRNLITGALSTKSTH